MGMPIVQRTSQEKVAAYWVFAPIKNAEALANCERHSKARPSAHARRGGADAQLPEIRAYRHARRLQRYLRECLSARCARGLSRTRARGADRYSAARGSALLPTRPAETAGWAG